MKNLSEVLNPGKYQTPNDDAYMAQIQQYRNQSWYNRLLENPWLYSKNAEFSPNFFQTLGEQFNDFSARDRYYAELQSNQQQWLSDMLSQMHGQDYDSASQQTARMREAGLNPDLNGNVSAGEAGQNDQPIQPLNMPSESVFQDAYNIGSNILQTALSVYSGFQSIEGVGFDNLLKEVSVNDGTQSLIDRLFSDSVTEFATRNENSSMSTIIDNKDVFLDALYSRVDNLPVSNRYKKRIKNSLKDSLYFSTDDDSYALTSRYEKIANQELSKLYNSRGEFIESFSKVGVQDANQMNMRWTALNVFNPINKLNIDLMSLELQNKTRYLRDSLNLSLPENKARSENSDYLLRGDIKTIQSRITSTFEEINKKILGSRQISPTWKMALQVGVSSAESMIISNLIK